MLLELLLFAEETQEQLLVLCLRLSVLLVLFYLEYLLLLILVALPNSLLLLLTRPFQ
jgi:hypothetical protein